MKKITCLLVHICYSNTVLIAQEPTLMLPIGHTQVVNTAQFNFDDKRIVTSSADGTAKIWDAITGYLLSDLRGHTMNVRTASFGSDGKKIVTSSMKNDYYATAWDSSAIVWDAGSGKKLLELKGHKGNIRFAQFSPDNSKIVTGSNDSTTKIWDATTGKLIADLKSHRGAVIAAEFSPDGKKIVTSAEDKIAKIWDAVNGILLTELKGHANNINSVHFSTEGDRILTASGDNTARIWDAASGAQLLMLKGHRGWVESAQFSPDGNKIITSSFDNTVKIWETSTGRKLLDISGYTFDSIKWRLNRDLILGKFTPDGKKIIVYNIESPVLLDAASGKLIAILKGHKVSVNFIEFSNAGDKIVSASYDGTAKIWSVASGSLLVNLAGHTSSVNSAVFHPDNKKIITAYGDSTVRIWDVNHGSLLGELEGLGGPVTSARFSPDGKMIVTSSRSSTAKIWEAHTGKLLNEVDHYRLSNASRNLTKCAFTTSFSPDNRKIVTTGFWDRNARIWDAGTTELIKEITGKRLIITTAEFSPDGKQIVTTNQFNRTTTILDASSGEIHTELEEKEGFVYNIHNNNGAKFSPDGMKVVTSSTDQTAKIWDIKTASILLDLKGHTEKLTYAEFSPDGKKVVTAAEDMTAKIWDATKGSVLAELRGHLNTVNTANFSPDGKKIATASLDNSVKIWDATNGKLIVSFIAVDSNDYLLQIPGGYYMCTPDAAKLLYYVTSDLKVITFEQLDVKYNRPDKVLEAIGNTDTSLINAYRAAYYKRIKKLGIDTLSFKNGISVPEADFINRNEIAYEQKNKELTLHIKGTDGFYNLDRFNVWINETPVFGLKGINIRWYNTNSFDTVVTITLSQGENRIETSFVNVNGTESYRTPLFINYSPEKPERELAYLIGIGINNYEQDQYNLHYSVKDIRDLSLKFKGKYRENIHIDTLYNEKVTVSNIKALKEILKKTTENDKVIISYSGHGLFSKEYDYYLSTYNINFRDPELNGLSYDDLEGLLDGIPARKKLLLIDACHSGEVDKEEMYSMAKIQKELDPSVKGFYTYMDTTSKRLGMKNSFDLMQQLFVNVGKNTGTTIISAAAGTQFALERDDLENGVFTYSILESMKKYQSMNVNTLKQIVGKRVEELTKGLQKPTFRFKTIYFDWKIW